MKNSGTVFLLTDAQVPDEKFLVLINDLLASGEIADLFPPDEMENIISGLRNEVKGAGMQDTRENCWSYFIDRVRKQLKVSKYGAVSASGKEMIKVGPEIGRYSAVISSFVLAPVLQLVSDDP